MTAENAPGWPGIPPRWTSSAKSGVGTALSGESLVWFTLSHGILNEVYFPRVDKACIRDLGLIVTDGTSFFSEEKRSTRNDDGYGEHENGSPFDGTGIGRAWPLLTGERAHYEVAAGHRDEAERLLRTFEELADDGGLIPEQTWDAPDIPERELFFGRPFGSARPLVWAHAEHIKLLRSLRDGRIFDQPPQTVERYIMQKQFSPYAVWRINNKSRSLEAGKKLRVELLSPSIVHWTMDGWQTADDTPTRDTGLGVYAVDLPTQMLPSGRSVEFTFFWPETDQRQGANFKVLVS
jgi:glucoamylase